MFGDTSWQWERDIFLFNGEESLFGAGAEDDFPRYVAQGPTTSSVGSRRLLRAQSRQPRSSLLHKLPSGLRGSHLRCPVAFLWAASEGRSPFSVVLSVVHSVPGLGLLPFSPPPCCQGLKMLQVQCTMVSTRENHKTIHLSQSQVFGGPFIPLLSLSLLIGDSWFLIS